MITVDPILDKETSRRIQIIWLVDSVKSGDIIKLFRTRDYYTAEPIFEVIPYSKYGISPTNIFESYLDTGLKFKPICMGFYAAYFRRGKVLHSSCLQTHPTWMKEYDFGDLRLIDMFIPGTHDSSAYHTAYTPQSVNRIDKYVYTQEQNILEQLLAGARALDLRVGKDGDVYKAHHGVADLYPFQEVLNEIKIFVERTEEIIILDFHDFPVGFPQEEDHLKFVEFFYSQIGDVMVSPTLGWGATLQQIWDTGKRVIVSYNVPAVVKKKKDILWPPIKQMWGNKQNVVDLYDYFTNVFKNPPQGMWSAQAELTAALGDIVVNDLGGLRKMAKQTNTQVSKWFRGEWGDKCHIVAMDFIRASSIVDVALEKNLCRKLKKYRRPRIQRA